MDSVLRGLPFVFVYLDDILVASCSVSKHKSHLHQVFQHLAEHGMINFYNCFLPRASHLLQPLYAALKGKTDKDLVDWLPECNQA